MTARGRAVTEAFSNNTKKASKIRIKQLLEQAA